MKKILLLITFLLGFYMSTQAFSNVTWLDGTKGEPSIQIQSLNEDTFILRESPRVDPEAPFMYLLFGESKALLLDTGMLPSKNSAKFPLQTVVQSIIDEWQKKHGNKKIELLVAHSHSHDDHIGGDYQFENKPNTTIVGTTLDEVIQFYGFTNWPHHSSQLNLGNRLLEIIPIPGHEKSHIAIYDYQTEILLTGDTLYPGRLYIEDWKQYQNSIAKLIEFTKRHPVSYILGCHIEMTNEPYTDFRFEVINKKFQHALQLSVSHLQELNDALQMMADMPRKKAYPDFIIEPVEKI